jgi:hypothetical protein
MSLTSGTFHRRCRRVARKIPVFLVLLFAARAAHAAPSCEHRGTQTWETFEDNHPLTEKTDLMLAGGLRTGCGFSGISPYYERAQAGFEIQAMRHLQFRPYYMLIVKQPGTQRTHSIALEINANNLALAHWRVTDKNRMEESFQPSGATTRYTNEAQFTRPISWGDARIEPYVKGQAKYDLRYLGWVYTRVYAGINKPLTPKVSLDGYFVRQFGSHLSPGTANAIGLTVHTRF